MRRNDVKTKNGNLTHNNVVCNLADTKFPCLHTLMELSIKQWRRYSPNSIYVSGINYTNNNVLHSTTSFGRIILLKRRTVISNGVQLHYREPLLRNIDGGYIFIVGNKEELISSDKSIIILNGSN